MAAVAGEASIDSAVLVQVLNDAAETTDLLAVAASDPASSAWSAGSTSPRPTSPTGRPRCAQDRTVRRRDPAPGAGRGGPGPVVGQPAVQQGLAAVARAGLPFDLMFRPEHVEAVLRTVRAHPGADLRPGPPGQAADRVGPGRVGARHPRAVEGAERDLQAVRDAHDGRPGLDGGGSASVCGGSPRRLRPAQVLFGSDWPVSLLAASYAEGVAAVEQLLQSASEVEREQVFGATAMRIYDPS